MDRHDRLAQGLRALPREGGRGVRGLAPLQGGRILGSLDNVLAEVVEGNRGMVTPAFPKGISAAAVNGCWQCHGCEVKVLPGGKLDPATWPNTGIGRINPDGSEGSCSACHSRHAFSAAQARHPDNCGKCHMGPDHPQKEIYDESKHGIAFRAFKDKMNLESAKWIVGEDYHAGPDLRDVPHECHAGPRATKDRPATPGQPVTHDVGMRISWNNRPADLGPSRGERREDGPAGRQRHLGDAPAKHEGCLPQLPRQQWVDNFYVQYDGLIDLYNEKFAKPGLELYALAKPLMRPVKFANKLDFTWFEIWHHEGRRARHGASMMGPDYTHWHGTYEVAKHFYTKMIPELEELAREARHPTTRKRRRREAWTRRSTKCSTIDHRWYLNKTPPEEKAERKKQQDEFKSRYSN